LEYSSLKGGLFMAINVNRVTLVGRVGRDPEQKGSGDGFMTFSLATSRQWKDSSGNRQEKTEWHNIVVFNQIASRFVRDYVRKGDLVLVEGRIESRTYQKDSGEEVKLYEIIVAQFEGQVQAQSLRSNDSNEE